MSEVHVTETGAFNLERVNKLLAGLGDNGSSIHKAVYNALRRAADSGKTQAGRFAAEQYTISKGQFMSHIRSKTIQKGGHLGVDSVQIIFAGQVIPLIEFHTRFSKDGGVSTSVKRGGGGVLSHAFIANIGGTSVFERITTRRFPVEKKYGPSAAHMMMNETVVENMDEHITSVFNERIEHEITRILNGW